jgi:hypothetical protein
MLKFSGITHATSFSASVGMIQNPKIQNGISHSSARPKVVTVKIVLSSIARRSINQKSTLKANAITNALLKCPLKCMPGIAGSTHLNISESTISLTANFIKCFTSGVAIR